MLDLLAGGARDALRSERPDRLEELQRSRRCLSAPPQRRPGAELGEACRSERRPRRASRRRGPARPAGSTRARSSRPASWRRPRLEEEGRAVAGERPPGDLRHLEVPAEPSRLIRTRSPRCLELGKELAERPERHVRRASRGSIFNRGRAARGFISELPVRRPRMQAVTLEFQHGAPRSPRASPRRVLRQVRGGGAVGDPPIRARMAAPTPSRTTARSPSAGRGARAGVATDPEALRTRQLRGRRAASQVPATTSSSSGSGIRPRSGPSSRSPPAGSRRPPRSG